jgi:hypothetical protein
MGTGGTPPPWAPETDPRRDGEPELQPIAPGKLYREELPVPRRARRLIKISERLVPVSSTPCSASTSGLSTWWSTTALHPYGIEISSWSQFHAYMLSAFIWSEHSYPAMLLAEQPVHQRFVRPGPLVLGSKLLKSPTPTADRDRTVSRRSEPRSRTALMGEQPNPWDLLQPQDATIRHRGAKPPRRCGLLGEISLLSPE